MFLIISFRKVVFLYLMFIYVPIYVVFILVTLTTNTPIYKRVISFIEKFYINTR